jgi:hypothetical protein
LRQKRLQLFLELGRDAAADAAEACPRGTAFFFEPPAAEDEDAPTEAEEEDLAFLLEGAAAAEGGEGDRARFL